MSMETGKITDTVFLTVFILGFLGGLWISLKYAGELLGYNVQTLMICAIICTVLAGPGWLRRRVQEQDMKLVALALIPIGLRTAFGLALLTYASYITLEGLVELAEIIGLMSLIAVAEETFRAAIYNIMSSISITRGERHIQLPAWACWLVANGLWLLFHFAQRDFAADITTLAYTAWLFVSGLVLSVIMAKAGLGPACLAHAVINLSA